MAKWQIVERNAKTLEIIHIESRTFDTKQDCKRMIAQFGYQLTRGLESGTSPSIHEYLGHEGYDSMFVRIDAGRSRAYYAEPILGKKGGS